MANLNFAIALNLLTDKFKSGANSAKNSLRELQAQGIAMAAAFGAGSLGIGEFVSKLIDTARETSRVSIALKNISGDAKAYGENQKFLIDLSKKYGLYINDLTSNYSKFTAAANMAGMSTKNQQKIFEALSRATVNYGLSADESNGVFLALSQMMGKGTIQAQELKLQMGEKLPVALAAMAKAAHTSVAGMTKMMEQGKLTTAVLPAFADELNKLTKNANLDNIETSFNKLKNKFKELTDKLNVANIYKGLLDQTNGAFAWIMNNLKTVGNVFVNIIATLVIGKGIKMIVGAYSDLARATEKSLRLQAKLAGETFEGMGTGISKFGKMASFAMKSAFATFAPMIIISGLVAIYQYFDNIVQKQKEIKAIWGDYQKSVKNAGGSSEEIVKMQSLQRVMNNKFENQKNINSAQRELMGMLGLEKANQTEINRAVAKRIELLKESARAQVYTDVAVSTEKKIDDLSSSKNLTTNQSQELTRMYVKGGGENDKNYLNIINKLNSWNAGGAFKNFSGGYNKDDVFGFIKEIGALNRVGNDANRHLDKSVRAATTDTKYTDPEGKHKKTDLEKAEEEYTKEIQKLTLEKANGVITEKEYQRAIDAQNKETYKKIGGLDKNAANNKIFKEAKKGVDNPYETDVKKIENDYNDALKDLTIEKKLGLKTSDEYDSALKTLINSTVKSIFSNDKINIAGSEFAQALINQKKLLDKKDYSLPEMGKIDHTFDYKKNDVEKAQDKKDVQDKYKTDLVEKLKKNGASDNIEQLVKNAHGDLNGLTEKFGVGLADSIIALDEAIKNCKSLDEALKIQEVKKDIKDLQKELNNGIYDGVKNVAGSAKNMYEGFKAVTDTLNNVDATGWEKFLSVWDALTNTIDGMMSIVKTIETITEVTKKLTLAKKVEQTLDDAATAKKVTNAALTAGAALAGSATVAAAATTEVAANTAAAGSGAAASVAAVPIVGPILAVAAVGSVLAMLASSLPKFESGGIVGGASYTGDKILARINSGEMILNQGQQNSLFGLLNGGGSNSNQPIMLDVNWKLRGKDLVAVIANENNIKSKVKK